MADISSTSRQSELREPLKPAAAFAEGAAAYPAGAPAGPADVAHEDDGPMRFRGNGGESTTRPRRGAAVPGLAANCWGQDELKQRYPQLTEDVDADVCIVGGGISGLTTAYLLAKAGKRVVLLESRLIGSGQTGRSLGDMTPWHTGLFSSLERWTNREQRQQVAVSNAEAINFVESVVESEGISCGFTRCPNFLLAAPAVAVPGDSRDPRSVSSRSGDASVREGERVLMQEYEASKVAGLDVNMVELDRKAAGGGRALQLPDGAVMNPLLYVQGLAAAITGKYGGRIYETTRMRKADPSARTLTTMEGHTVTTRQGYVLATASPVTSSILDSALHVLALHGKQHVRRRYVVALKILKNSGYQLGVYYGISLSPSAAAAAAAAAAAVAAGMYVVALKILKNSGYQPGVYYSISLSPSAAAAAAAAAAAVAAGVYVVALKVPKNSGYQPGVYYDAGEPQHTALITPGKASTKMRAGYHDLLLVSGEAHDQGKRPSQYGQPLQQLESWARTRWPAAGERLYAWSYNYFQTAEDLGLYGSDPTITTTKDVYVATGDCGRIMTGGTLGGNIIASQILGWPAAQLYKDLYNPSRKLRGGIPGLPAWSPRYFKNTIQSALDMLLPLPHYVRAAGDIENLARGEGAIINSGLRKVAVYKDDAGEVTRMSGLCPHLGCLLQWNPEDKEWNCPCHGSCFDKQGANICGPATIDMTQLKSK
uniref:Rieske domain-containing protein n=1 Tax=Tetradesmus obliquus TaxID=3088 RepID=A0A383W2I3_TETOB|eukprot:jgi/Sobl393_1/20040/SZX71430.1